jgi:hypothetical protein
MHLLLLVLQFLFLSTNAQISTVWFGVSPQCYNHQIGGGAINDRTVNTDIERSLQGGQFACNDRVSFIWVIEATGSAFPNDGKDHNATWVINFNAATTAKSATGVGFGYVAGLVGEQYYDGIGTTYVNLPSSFGETAKVINGEGSIIGGAQCALRNGRDPPGFDTGVISNGNEVATITKQEIIKAPIFQKASDLQVTFQVTGIAKNEIIPIRLDVVIMCNGKPAIGNLQADIVSAVMDNSIVLGSGSQTIPLQSAGDILPCFGFGTNCKLPVADGLQNFCATLNVSGTGYQNGATQTGKVWYDWATGSFQYYLGLDGASGSWSEYSYTTNCESTQASQESFKYSSCGCEPVLQFPTSQQPQLFFAGNQTELQPAICQIPDVSVGGSVQYWQLVSVVDKVRTYSVIGDQAFPFGPTRLVITDGRPTQVTWIDGTVWNLSGAAASTLLNCLGPNSATPTSCTSAPVCGRPLDIVLLLERSSGTNSIEILETIAFAGQFVNSFTFGPTAVQMAVWSFNTTAQRYIGLTPDRTTAFNAVGQIGVGTGPQVGTNYRQALERVVTTEFSATANLRTNAQKVVVVVLNNFDDAASQIASYIASLPVDPATLFPEIQIIAVPYSTFNLQPELFALVTNGDPQNLYQVFDDCSSKVGECELAKITNVRRVSARVCGFAQPSALCGSCCAGCDTSCVAQPCTATGVTCTPSPRCGQTFVLVDTSNGTNPTQCCAIEYSGGGCPGYNATTCTSAEICSETGVCLPGSPCSPSTTPCTTNECINGACTPTPVASINICNTSIGTCSSCVCNATSNTYVIINSTTCVNTGVCAFAECDQNNDCQINNALPDPNPEWVTPCNERFCDASLGWSNRSVSCPAQTCKNVVCDPSVGCRYTDIVCANASNVCDTSSCVGGTCVNSTRTCDAPNSCTVCACTSPVTGCTCEEDPAQIGPGKTHASLFCCLNPAACVVPNVTTNSSCVDCVSDACTTRFCPPGSTVCQQVPVDCENLVRQTNDFCLRTSGCNITAGGCQIEPINCDQTPDNCTRFTAQSTVPGCCVKSPVSCPSDPCNQGSCDVSTNACILTPLCATTNPCFNPICTPTGCGLQPKCTSALSGCSSVDCNITSGQCATTINFGVCSSPDPCVVGSCVVNEQGNQSCVFTPFCSPSADACNPTTCVANGTTASCVVVPKECPTSNGCVQAGCLDGACFQVAQDTQCNDLLPCYSGTCNISSGNCSYVALDCLDPANWPAGVNQSSYCAPIVCDPLSLAAPCQPRSKVCADEFQNLNESCDTVSCVNNETNINFGSCVLEEASCFNFAALIAGLAGGAIAGIVLAAAFIGLVTCSGAGAAIALSQADLEDNPLSLNPLYNPNNLGGQNPMHRP